MNLHAVPAKGRRLPGHTPQPSLQRYRAATSTGAGTRLRDIAVRPSDVLDEHSDLSTACSSQALCAFLLKRQACTPFCGQHLQEAACLSSKSKKLAVKKSSLRQSFSNEKLLMSNSCDTDHQKLAFLKFLLSTLC